MTYWQLAGFSASILIGVSLGLIGGGGSILTLPVLVYLLGINPVVSTTYSLFVVGTTSLVGAVGYMRQRLISYHVATVFALPSFVAVYLTRTLLVPALPDPLLTTGSFTVSKNMAIMVLLAAIMLAASWSLIRKRNSEPQTSDGSVRFNVLLIGLEGLLVGTLTGVVGAGGGFLIIPALVLLARLPMKTAVGTSLLIIALNSLIGFLGTFTIAVIDWSFLLRFTALSVMGVFLGTYLTRFVAGHKLRTAFGWFVLVMSLYILSRELLFTG